jgi:hypothetical protein
MPPKKTVPAAATKKAVASPAHASYKGQLNLVINHNALASLRIPVFLDRVSMLTLSARYDQGSHP